ncbi:hypothetical protein LTR16_003657 [Cryomyces antarcticus]|uniref:peptidylprolyl isomerase n=1 Tax=Cryomyces antarcticus TaxID=329879 RepID=A0ABR0KSC6_9PEZI|nr:hypothetical protein LTR60_004434 [Cryomyces antarcticus]KAK5123854.1 hypothetical protein LTR16_003657 [Cryomyces antarcticus]
MSCARRTQNGDSISVNYRGTLASDGSEFDASYNRGVPFTFTLGKGQVIQGWDRGLLDMCVGEARRLTIPPEMAYGDRNMGIIPPGSTLVFETELEAIKGVPKPTITSAAATPTAEANTAPSAAVSLQNMTATLAKVAEAAATSTITTATGSNASPLDKEKPGADDGECRLLGPFALIIQAALGALALLSLVFKRYRERPRRPLKIWWFDVSKQLFGSVLLHLANLFMSMLSSGDFDVAAKAKAMAAQTQGEGGRKPNPCSFYLLNLAIDTTIGIPILVVLLRILHHAVLLTHMVSPPESIKSGNYGQPPRATWWLKQSTIYFVGLFGMKLCVFFIFQLLPWLGWVGDWALRWTENSEALQITFVMFVFPVIMNAIQYYIIDGFIKSKDPAGGEEHGEEGEEREPLRRSEDDDGDEHDAEEPEVATKTARISAKEALKEANLTPVPAGYDPDRDGQGSGNGSSSPTSDKEVRDAALRRRSGDEA